MFRSYPYEHHLTGWHEHMTNIRKLTERFRGCPFNFDRYDFHNKGHFGWDSASFVWSVLFDEEFTVKGYWRTIQRLGYLRPYLGLMDIYDAIEGTNCTPEESAYYWFTFETLAYIQKDMYHAAHWKDHFIEAMAGADDLEQICGKAT